MWILGLNGPPIGWHDAAACLVDGDGHVWAMTEEERLNRVKHAPHTYPALAAQFCLDQVGLTPGDIDVVAIGWDLPETYLTSAVSGSSVLPASSWPNVSGGRSRAGPAPNW